MGNDDISSRILNCGTIPKSVVSFMLLPFYLRSFPSTPLHGVIWGGRYVLEKCLHPRGTEAEFRVVCPVISLLYRQSFPDSWQFFRYFCCARWNSSELVQDTLLNMAVEWAVLLIVIWRYRVQMSSRKPANSTADFRVFPYSSQESSENIASV